MCPAARITKRLLLIALRIVITPWLPDVLRSSGLVNTIKELLERNSNGSGLGSREYGR
jgi:hypothetical protein